MPPKKERDGLNDLGHEELDQVIDDVLNDIAEVEKEEAALQKIKAEEDERNRIIDEILDEDAKEEEPHAQENPAQEEPIQEVPVQDAPKVEEPKAEEPKAEGIDIFDGVAEQVAALENEPDELDNDVNATMFVNRLDTFNKVFKTNLDANNFISRVTDAWGFLKMEDKQKQADGRKILGELFKDVISKAFDAERELSYGEHRLPDYAEIARSANELLRVSMFTFTDLYTNKKSEALFAQTAFGGLSAKEMAALTSENSLWKMDQKSDAAWEIQSSTAKDIANQWLGEEKPYEKMINEMNALAEKDKNSIIDADRKEILNKLAAAEWLLLNNDKMMIDNPEDPLAKMPNWGNRYWKAIIQARQALGIPKHISMRELIQGDYAESSKAVNNVKYNEIQLEEQVLDPDMREVYDSMEAQKTEFTVQRAAIATSHPSNEKRINGIEMKGDRVPYPVPELDERKILLDAPKEMNFIQEKAPEVRAELNKA